MRVKTGKGVFGQLVSVHGKGAVFHAWNLTDRALSVKSGCGDWDVAWHVGRTGGNVTFPASLDTAPHRAFVAGVMPAYAYADWLEENVPEVPGTVLALLREPAEVST